MYLWMISIFMSHSMKLDPDVGNHSRISWDLVSKSGGGRFLFLFILYEFISGKPAEPIVFPFL